MKQRTMKEAIQRVGSNTYDAIRKNARAYSKHFFPAKCMICDYDKHYEVCHVKDLKDFTREETVYEVNNKTNLIHLCPNCHWFLIIIISNETRSCCTHTSSTWSHRMNTTRSEKN